MSLPHILLGMLAEPASGYDLRQLFQQSVRHFWSAELSQIYPALARLERDGLATSEQAPSLKGPPRKIYRRTPAGQEALIAWLSSGPIVRNDRIAFLTQLFFLDEIDLEARIAFFRELRDDFAAHHAELEAVETHWRSEDPRYPDELPARELTRQMTLLLGQRKYAMTRDWADECMKRLETLRPPPE